MTCSTCHTLLACGLKRGRGTLFGLISGFLSQTLSLTRPTRYLGGGGNVDMDTLHGGGDTGL